MWLFVYVVLVRLILDYVQMVLIGLVGVVYFFFSLVQYDHAVRDVDFIVHERAGLSDILHSMGRNGIITYPNLTRLLLVVLRCDRLIVAGEYRVLAGMKVTEVLRDMISGKVLTRFFTVVPGTTSRYVIDALRKNVNMVGDVPDVADGTIFPDTYNYHYGTSRSELLRTMQNKAIEEYGKVWSNEVYNIYPRLPIKSLREAIVMASILEKEVHGYEDMCRAAGVFYLRLKRGMRLQSDATVVYAVTDGSGEMVRKLRKSDYYVKSQYNTYYVYGLPSTPISNPSLLALKAVFNPDIRGDLYFLTLQSGQVIFSKDLKTHSNFRKLLFNQNAIMPDSK